VCRYLSHCTVHEMAIDRQPHNYGYSCTRPPAYQGPPTTYIHMYLSIPKYIYLLPMAVIAPPEMDINMDTPEFLQIGPMLCCSYLFCRRV